MFSIPTYRIRAYIRSAQAKKEAQAARPVYHLKRVAAEIRTTDAFASDNEVIPARVVLNDFSSHGVVLFSTKSLLVGQLVSISLQHPRKIFLKGRVMFSKVSSLHQKVLSNEVYDARIGVQFQFASTEERRVFHQYWNEITFFHLTRPGCI